MKVVRRDAPAPGIVVEEGPGVLQVGWVEVPGAESGASGEGNLEEIGGGAREHGVPKTVSPCPLEQVIIRRAEEVPGCA